MVNGIDEGREARGRDLFREIIGIEPAAGPLTPASEAVRNFGFAEVWSRPGLDRRSRRWITLACVTAACSPNAMRAYARAAITSGDITMPELREFSLQFAVFQGFPRFSKGSRIRTDFERNGTCSRLLAGRIHQ